MLLLFIGLPCIEDGFRHSEKLDKSQLEENTQDVVQRPMRPVARVVTSMGPVMASAAHVLVTSTGQETCQMGKK